MSELNPNLQTKKPANVLLKPLTADFKSLFKALAKGIGHFTAGKWEELGNDTVEALCSLGLATAPEELAYLLVQRSITLALFELVGEIAGQDFPEVPKNPDEVIAQIDFSLIENPVSLDQKFFDRPADLTLIKELKTILLSWLEKSGINHHQADAIAQRFPTYFVYALNKEWRKNSKSYQSLKDSLETPFTKAGEKEWAWAEYNSLLQKRVEENIFDEPFGLSQIFVPLNAYYLEPKKAADPSEDLKRPGEKQIRVVVPLEEEMTKWLESLNPQDAIRVLSGGPGSGKSSFVRIFAARLAAENKIRVLYIPLHLIDPIQDLTEEVGRFVTAEGILPYNPLDAKEAESNLLLIFDGLDELASQGKAALETARDFIREVEKTVELRNRQALRLKVLISGRELVIQENEPEFRHPRQILNLLPYFTGASEGSSRQTPRESEEFHDPDNLLKTDLRDQWWKRYGELTGRNYPALPEALKRTDLDEITSQPLLNYLLALSYVRGKIDFTADVNLNAIYHDLVVAVHERAYEAKRPYTSIRHMKLEDFIRVLEEIGLAAWHGDGRTTTVKEIIDHCNASGIPKLLEGFIEGAEKGFTRLLAAFFFRQYGRRPAGDQAFVFTHKSFGEYLAARRIVRAMEKVNLERQRREDNADDGWDEKDCLRHWAQICGPINITPYLRGFILDELPLRNIETVNKVQECFTRLFSFVLRHSMPMELLNLPSFRIEYLQANNSEEALLVALNATASVTRKISFIEHPRPNTFGTWLKRIQGKITGRESTVAEFCLSFFDLQKANLDIMNLCGANLANSLLQYLSCFHSFLADANLVDADLSHADLAYSYLFDADLTRAQLNGADLSDADISDADLSDADLSRTDLSRTFLTRADLTGANLTDADLTDADLTGANLTGANLTGANLTGADLTDADLTGANLTGANLTGANLTGANLNRADLRSANISGATISKEQFKEAIWP